jgi:hypothetical protein
LAKPVGSKKASEAASRQVEKGITGKMAMAKPFIPRM